VARQIAGADENYLFTLHWTQLESPTSRDSQDTGFAPIAPQGRI
jgi:hypothetical protein